MDFARKIVLAPMAGVTDSIFRRLCRRLGADITWSEMVSAEGLVRDGEKSLRLLNFTTEERPLGLQLFGADPESMRLAAGIATERRPDFIDLNFGCPVPKVVKRNGGASLMKDPARISELTRAAVRGAGGVPVTAKIRSGWSASTINYLEVAQRLVDSGAAAIAFHARTRLQGYTGQADWEQIRRLKETCPLPVIGSGDVAEPEDARRMMEATGCDSVMIGRAALGNPWLLGRARAVLDGNPDPGAPGAGERLALALEHLDLSVAEYGDPQGILMMRKHLGWYTRGLAGGVGLRRLMFEATGRDRVVEIINSYLERILCTRSV